MPSRWSRCVGRASGSARGIGGQNNHRRARAPPDPLLIRVFPAARPARAFLLLFVLALPADAPTGQGARAAAEVRQLLREMLRVPRDVLQLRVQGENQETRTRCALSPRTLSRALPHVC